MQGFRKEKNLRFTVQRNGGCNHEVKRHAPARWHGWIVIV